MSEHHTRIEESQLIAEVEELERLKRGNIEEVENARKRRSKYYDRRRFYGNWDPLDSSVVWEDNDARAERLAELDYYRKPLTVASLDELKSLVDFIAQHGIQ